MLQGEFYRERLGICSMGQRELLRESEKFPIAIKRLQNIMNQKSSLTHQDIFPLTLIFIKWPKIFTIEYLYSVLVCYLLLETN